MEAPKCRICQQRHWLRDPHVFDSEPVKQRAVKQAKPPVPSMAEVQTQKEAVFHEVTFRQAGYVAYDWDARRRELGLDH